MNTRMIGAIAAVALLAGCATQQEQVAAGSGAPAGPVPGSQEDLVANVGDRIFFDFDRATVRPDGRVTLDRQAEWLAKYPNVRVLIAGNCDERGTTEYNLALGQRRANAAFNYLRTKGVAAARMETISYGKDRPTALGSNEQAWAQNRNAITSVR